MVACPWRRIDEQIPAPLYRIAPGQWLGREMAPEKADQRRAPLLGDGRQDLQIREEAIAVLAHHS